MRKQCLSKCQPTAVNIAHDEETKRLVFINFYHDGRRCQPAAAGLYLLGLNEAYHRRPRWEDDDGRCARIEDARISWESDCSRRSDRIKQRREMRIECYYDKKAPVRAEKWYECQRHHDTASGKITTGAKHHRFAHWRDIQNTTIPALNFLSVQSF